MRLLGLIPYNLQRRAWIYSEILNVRDQVAAGVKTAVIAQRLSRTQDGVKGIMKAHGIRYGANSSGRQYRGRKTRCCAGWPPRANRIERLRAGSVAGSTACRIEARCFTKGQWSETLPARRLRGCQRAAYSSSRGLVVLQNHHRRRSALLYPRKTACNGARAASCAPHQAKRKGTAREQTFPRGAFPSRATP